MKKWLSYFLITVVGAISSMALAEETAKPSEKAPPMPEEWVKYGAPGENHKLLEPLVGKWNHKVQWWMGSQDQGHQSQGKNENKMILGGRFLVQVVKGSNKEQPFEGAGVIGYDNAKGEFQTVWLDNMATGMVKGVGHYNASTKTIDENGTYTDPTIAEKERTYRAVWKLIDNDHYVYEMYNQSKDGKEFKTLEVSYERAPAEQKKPEQK